MSLSSILLKKLREHQLRNIIKIFNDELKGLKDIFNKIKELELLGDQEINELKNETKRKLDMLDDEISDILEKSDVILTKKKKGIKIVSKRYNKWNRKIERKSLKRIRMNY